MSDDALQAERDARAQRLDRTSELFAALVLSVAALLSSYAGFQAELWDGEQAGHYTLAEQARTSAARSATIGGEIRIYDTMQFSQWLNAYATGEDKLEHFYRVRFRAEFERAFTAWLALDPRENRDAPSSPLAMPNYALAVDRENHRLQAQADREFALGERANDVSDAFEQATVIFAIALFMGGIVQAFKWHWLRVGMLTIAGLCAAIGIVRIIALPAMRLTQNFG